MGGGGRKQKINPCERKGEVQARTTEGGPVYRGAYRRYGACECIYDRCDFNKKGERVPLNFALSTDAGADCTPLWVKRKNALPKDTLLISPCTETFRDSESPGTRLYKRLLGNRTAFSGCQSVEEGLIREKLVRLWIDNRETLELSDILDIVVPSEDDFLVPISKGAYGTYARTIAYEDEVGLDEKRASVHKLAARVSVLTSSMADVIRAAPLNFRQSQARKLLEEGHFIRSEKLRLALFLVSRNITEPDLIARIAPELDYAEFKKLEGVVNSEIDKTLPEKARQFSKFLESLTAAQREALEQVYLKNDYGLTQEDVAKKLGISLHSLTDRLEGAKKKLKSFYPEFKRKRANGKTGALAGSDTEAQPLPSNGKRAASEEQVVVILINPMTGERKQMTVAKSAKNRTRIKPDVNKYEIRRWIQDRCPIPYPAI